MDYLMLEIDPTVVAIALVLMGLDILLGLAGAVKDKNVQSSRMREGLWHKAGSIGLIGLADILELAVDHIDLGLVFPGVIAVCAYIIVMEVGSCLENLVVLNPELKHNPILQVFATREEKDESNHNTPATA